jgi:hypothetical protein
MSTRLKVDAYCWQAQQAAAAAARLTPEGTPSGSLPNGVKADESACVQCGVPVGSTPPAAAPAASEDALTDDGGGGDRKVRPKHSSTRCCPCSLLSWLAVKCLDDSLGAGE